MNNEKAVLRSAAILWIVIQLTTLVMSLYFCKPIERVQIGINYLFSLPMIIFSFILSIRILLGKTMEAILKKMYLYQQRRLVSKLMLFSVWGTSLSAILVATKSNHHSMGLEVSVGILGLILYSLGFIYWIITLSFTIVKIFNRKFSIPQIDGPFKGKDLDIALAQYNQKRMRGESDTTFKKRVFAELIIQKRSEESKKLLICILLNVKSIDSLPEDIFDTCLGMFKDPPSVRDIDLLLSKVT